MQPDGDDHGVRRPAVHVANQTTEGHDELEIAHVLVGMLRRRDVIKHQVEAGDCEDDEKEEREAAQAEGVRHSDPRSPDANRMDMEHEVGQRRPRRDLIGQWEAMAEHRRGHLPQDRPHLVDRRADDLHEPSVPG